MNSLYNTPCTWAIYILGEVLKWVENQGGVLGKYVCVCVAFGNETLEHHINRLYNIVMTDF